MWTTLRFNQAALGWPLLVFLPLLLLQRRWPKADWLCAVCGVIFPAPYFFFSYYGREFEARYYYSALPFVIPLVIRGIQNLQRLLARWFSPESVRSFLVIVVLALSLHALCYYWPCYLIPTYAGDYEQASPVVYEAARRAGLKQALILIAGAGPNDFRYSSGFVYNDPLLTSEVIFARDLPGTNACLSRAFPKRAVYRFIPSPDGKNGFFEACIP